MKKNTSYLPVLLLIIYIAGVFYGCLHHFSGTGIDLNHFFLGIRLDKIIHFGMFLPYALISWIFFTYSPKIHILKDYTASAILMSGLFIAFCAEGFQCFTPYREMDPTDLASNIIGILTGTLAVYLLRNRLEKKLDPYFGRNLE